MSDPGTAPSNSKRIRQTPKLSYNAPLSAKDLEKMLYDSDDDIGDPTFTLESDDDFLGDDSDVEEEVRASKVASDLSESEDDGTYEQVTTIPPTAPAAIPPPAATPAAPPRHAAPVPAPSPIWVVNSPGLQKINFSKRRELLVAPQGNYFINAFHGNMVAFLPPSIYSSSSD
ncbi:hypothetical protein NQ314_010219 [Rhamnusium bicolor]|uniref:Uncharacterized protein n=1 Tax=Rhamnusium bicolor TaxID=1586634 RepID=A0AAV8XSI1_9CUCU|nr:hypothetical protein NQ314_010219 [Rhamnusium bicolor]